MSISIHDVARQTGVSTATVSRALRGLPNVAAETREAVRRTAAELGYVASPSASGLASGRHHAVAAIIPSIDRWFYTCVIEGADEVLRKQDYDVFLVNLGGRLGDRERVFHNTLLRKRADAVLALGLDFSPEERRELRSLATPTVVVGGPVRGVLNIGVDEGAAAAIAVSHLIELGHTRIAHIGGEDEYGLDPSVGPLRHTAWERELAKHGVVPEPWWFASGAFLLAPAKQVALELLARSDRPTAVFAGSDEMAYGVLLAAHQLRIRVPEDLSVIGIDDHMFAESFGLTTVRQNPHAQGALAAQMLLDELAGRPVRLRRVKAPCSLVVRASTAPPSP